MLAMFTSAAGAVAIDMAVEGPTEGTLIRRELGTGAPLRVCRSRHGVCARIRSTALCHPERRWSASDRKSRDLASPLFDLEPRRHRGPRRNSPLELLT